MEGYLLVHSGKVTIRIELVLKKLLLVELRKNLVPHLQPLMDKSIQSSLAVMSIQLLQ